LGCAAARMEPKGEQICLVPFAAVALEGEFVEISPLARPRFGGSRKLIEQCIARDAVVYGVNSGFGKLSDVQIHGRTAPTPTGFAEFVSN